MSKSITLCKLQVNAHRKWRGMDWNQYGVAAGHCYLEDYYPDNLAWLNANCLDKWRVVCQVFMGQIPSAERQHRGEQQKATLGVELQFDDPALAVLYKLTWGNHD